MAESHDERRLQRRGVLLGSVAGVAAGTRLAQAQQPAPRAPTPAPAPGQPRQPNILVIWGDDIGIHNISAYNLGVMGYRTVAERGLDPKEHPELPPELRERGHRASPAAIGRRR
jgi:hypothetical protein